MMKRHVVETLLGAMVLGVAALFVVFAYRHVDINPDQGYTVFAVFNRVDGLHRGDDVRISGIKVGSVMDLNIDPQSYLAKISMSIHPDIHIDDEAGARILSDGLLGSVFVDVLPGSGEKKLAQGETIRAGLTQGSINLIDLLAKYALDDDKKDGDSQQNSKQNNGPKKDQPHDQ